MDRPFRAGTILHFHQTQRVALGWVWDCLLGSKKRIPMKVAA